MKIEKITENKIRVLLKNEDIKDKNIDLHTIMTKAIESQGFFLEMLNKAEEEVGFKTDGYRLLIEAYSSPENDFIFTITKYLDETKKKVVPRRRKINTNVKNMIYAFDNFESFCELCSYLSKSNLATRGLARSISLYEYNNIYYLIIKGINSKNVSCKTLFSVFSEFGRYYNVSTIFENKLLEHGKSVMKHNALNTGIRYFA